LGQVTIYCRVSTDDQSCDRQERDLRAFAKRAGHDIVAVFKETASGARNDRPSARRSSLSLRPTRSTPSIEPKVFERVQSVLKARTSRITAPRFVAGPVSSSDPPTLGS